MRLVLAPFGSISTDQASLCMNTNVNQSSHLSAGLISGGMQQLLNELKTIRSRVDFLEKENKDLRRSQSHMKVEVERMSNLYLKTLQADKEIHSEHGFELGSSYLAFLRAAYAVCALPIGTVLSVAPLYFKNELEISVETIGYLMMSGEICGVFFMKYAEWSLHGFVFHRPLDLYFILISVAILLLTIPLWPKDFRAGAAASMILVQCFNEASKCVMAEALYRMAVIMEQDSGKEFAKANQLRRMGNAFVGASTPLLYMANRRAPFFMSAPLVLLFTACLIHHKLRVDKATEDLSHWKRRFHIAYKLSHNKFRSATDERSQVKTPKKQDSTIGQVESLMKGGTASKRLHQQLSILMDIEAPSSAETHGSWFFIVLLLLTVYAFPFLDAFISRLPFTFLAVAIVEETDSLATACAVLLAYQSCRAISQAAQARRIDNAINYALCSIAIVAYVAVVVGLVIDPDASWWFYLIIPTGFSETLAIQQFYLVRLLDLDLKSKADNLHIRDLVKKSHTSTGVGSATAFFCSSAVYTNFDQLGVGYLGLGVAVAKLILVLFLGTRIQSTSKHKEEDTDICENAGDETQMGADQCDPDILLVLPKQETTLSFEEECTEVSI